MDEQEKRLHRVCFTGHRPEKLTRFEWLIKKDLEKEKGISQYTLIKDYHISAGQLTRLRRNESVSTHTIEMFCRILNCQVGDIMEYIADDEK